MLMDKAKVFFTRNITSDSLIKTYEALGVELTGKIGVKVSTGERGSKGYLKADLIGPFVKSLNGTIIECNTAYDGARNTVEDHMEVAKEHGFTEFADVDIMDAVNLAHGKGHAMGGFGANLKNQSIGIASRNGKAYIHTAGKSEDPNQLWNNLPEQINFIESMAEAAKAVADHLEEQNKPIVYITVMNALSVDCDCDAHQGDPVMNDLGIVASLDPVANDQAFIDLVWVSEDPGAEKLKARIDRQQGREILPYAESLGLGTREYELINIDEE